MKIADLLIGLLVDDKGFEADVVKKAGAAGEKAGTTMGGRIGGGLKKAFAGAGQHLTAIGTSAGFALAGAAESAVKLEDQLRTIQTVVPDLNLEKTREDLQALSRETGQTTDDLAAGFYDLVSAGVSADDAINVLRDSAKLAVGALGSTAQTVDLVTSALNAYGLSADQSGRVTDIFAKAVADGKVTAAELGDSLANIAPIAAAAGVSLEEVSAGYALLTAKGVPAAQAATQMRAAISALLTPNKQLNDIQKQTGINFAELAKEKGLAVALDAIRKATNGNADAFAKSLGSVEAYQFALATTGENAGAMAEQIVDTTNSVGLATEQYNIKSQSMAEQAKRLAAQIVTLGQDIGGQLGPLGQMLFVVNQMGPGLRGIISPAKLAGAALGGLAGKVAPTIAKGMAGFGKKISATIVAGFMEALIPTTIAGEAIGEAASTGAGGPKVAKLFGITGTRLGTILGTAIKIAAVVGIAAIASEIQGPINDIGKKIHEGLFGMSNPLSDFGASWKDWRKNTDWPIGQKNAPDWASLGQETEAGLETAIVGPMRAVPPDAADAIRNGKAMITAAGTAMMSGLGGAVTGALVAATNGGREVAKAFYQGVHEKQSLVKGELEKLVFLQETTMTKAQEIAYLTGVLTSTELAKGLTDGRDDVRIQAEATRKAAEERLEKLQPKAGNIGKATNEALAKGLKSKDPRVRAQAQRTADIIEKEIRKTRGKPAGQKAGDDLAVGLRSRNTKVARAAEALARQIGISLLSGIKGVAANAPLGQGRAVGGPVQAFEAYTVGERGTELFVPMTDGRIIPHHDLTQVDAASGTGGGNTYNVTLLDKMPARGVRDIGAGLRMLDKRGWLPGS